MLERQRNPFHARLWSQDNACVFEKPRGLGALPNTKSAAKALRRSERRRIRNRMWRSAARTFIKKARKLMEAGDLEAAARAIGDAISTLDRAAAKGVIHKNNAARRKSRLMKRFNLLVKARLQQQQQQQAS